MQENRTIEQLSDAFSRVGNSTADVINAVANLGEALSNSWVARNVIGLTDEEIDRNEDDSIQYLIRSNIKKNVKIDRQLYLREIQKYTGYRITLQDLENK